MKGGRVVAVIDWRAAASLKDNAGFIERAGISRGVRQHDQSTGKAKYRSLTLREDGSCELQRFTTATMVRRLDGIVVPRKVRKAGMVERG